MKVTSTRWFDNSSVMHLSLAWSWAARIVRIDDSMRTHHGQA